MPIYFCKLLQFGPIEKSVNTLLPLILAPIFQDFASKKEKLGTRIGKISVKKNWRLS